jgi:hypothetical protein
MSDITPAEFVARCEKAIEVIALADAHHPASETELALARLGESQIKKPRARVWGSNGADGRAREGGDKGASDL